MKSPDLAKGPEILDNLFLNINLEAYMSLHQQPIDTVPEKTAEIARAIFPEGNLYMKLFDTFGSLFSIRILYSSFPTMDSQLSHPSV